MPAIPSRFAARCSTCMKPIYWARTRAKYMPVDRTPVDNGNVTLVVEGKDLVAKVGASGPGQYVSHFVTCKQAVEHRGKGKAA